MLINLDFARRGGWTSRAPGKYHTTIAMDDDVDKIKWEIPQFGHVTIWEYEPGIPVQGVADSLQQLDERLAPLLAASDTGYALCTWHLTRTSSYWNWKVLGPYLGDWKQRCLRPNDEAWPNDLIFFQVYRRR
jgi:hypothetical protein